jgi:hypothetical protein
MKLPRNPIARTLVILWVARCSRDRALPMRNFLDRGGDRLRPCGTPTLRAHTGARASRGARGRVAGGMGAAAIRRHGTRSPHNRSGPGRYKGVRLCCTPRRDGKPGSGTHRVVREAARSHSLGSLGSATVLTHCRSPTILVLADVASGVRRVASYHHRLGRAFASISASTSSPMASSARSAGE